MHVFQAQFTAHGKSLTFDYPTGALAASAVEGAGEGSVVQFKKEKNMPGCLPEYRLFSLCLWVYENSKWMRKGIHGPTAIDLGEERPN